MAVADQNSYLRYKRDTRHLLYWMIHASNSILESSKLRATVPITVNTTGQLPVSALVPISKLIAEHINPIPSTIYGLFQSVIAARTATHSLFQQIATKTPDPEIERSNASHKRFIDVLSEAFETLGGSEWSKKRASNGEFQDDEDPEQVIFANKFSSLAINANDDVELEAEEGNEEDVDKPSKEHLPAASKRKPTGKGKRGKQGKKGKGKQKPAVKESPLEEVPLESYRIIEDEDGLVTDYLMAVYSLVMQWLDLRQYVQGIWREVAYGGLNSAVAGTMSNTAIAMIKQAESAIFVDFPGHDAYETVMKTITRGDAEKAQGMFTISLSRMGPNDRVPEVVQETAVDVKEHFMIHAYSDLLDFILNFQLNRSGKPTKSMQAELRNWDPNFDLKKASEEERVKWRRAYTINWLYDLVNVFSSIVVQRITIKKQNIVLEDVDWSKTGPWNEHRRLFGLNEFAGEITTLAMQKPGVDVRRKILPHHVFQIQCIVDSLMVSRGWSVTSLRGHIMSAPARNFRPRRDVDLFMDRENKRFGQGYCSTVQAFAAFIEHDANVHGNPERSSQLAEMLKGIRDDFVDWLGESKYQHFLTNIPPSRFTSSNSNGLWEYSPFLCGVGLMEALEITYAFNFTIWESMPEAMCVIHLHNMLVHKGYIKKEIGLYRTLQDLFPTSFFAGGIVPTSDFQAKLGAVVNVSRRATFQTHATRATARRAVDIHGILNMEANRFFKTKSMLQLYREVEWIPERIKDEDLHLTSAIAMLRLGETKQVIDPVSGKRVLESTPLVCRARAIGMSDKVIHQAASLAQNHVKEQVIPEEFLPALPEGHTRMPSLPQKGSKFGGLEGRQLLNLLKLDAISEISGQRPILSLNYVGVTIQFLLLFSRFEEELKILHNPSYLKAYVEEPNLMREKRLSLTVLALSEQDEECMKVMAKIFETPRAGFMNFIYWEDLEDLDSDIKTRVQSIVGRDPYSDDPSQGTGCTVM